MVISKFIILILQSKNNKIEFYVIQQIAKINLIMASSVIVNAVNKAKAFSFTHNY